MRGNILSLLPTYSGLDADPSSDLKMHGAKCMGYVHARTGTLMHMRMGCATRCMRADSTVTWCMHKLQSARGLYVYNMDGLTSMKGLEALKTVKK